MPNIKAREKAIGRLPADIEVHFVRETARSVRILAASLEISVIHDGDLAAAQEAYRSLSREVYILGIRLGLES